MARAFVIEGDFGCPLRGGPRDQLRGTTLRLELVSNARARGGGELESGVRIEAAISAALITRRAGFSWEHSAPCVRSQG